MRDYGRVHTAFWGSPDLQALTDRGKLLALYLLTSPHATIVGAYRVPLTYVAEDLRWQPEEVRSALGELVERGFAEYCPTTCWLWIRKYLRWNPPANPNQRKACARLAKHVPDGCAWRGSFFDALTAFLAAADAEPTPPKRTGKGSETVSSGPVETVPVTVCEPFRNGSAGVSEYEQEMNRREDRTHHTTTPPARERHALSWVVPYPSDLYREHVDRIAHDDGLPPSEADRQVFAWATQVVVTWTAEQRPTHGISNFAFWRKRFREWRGESGLPAVVRADRSSLEMRIRRADPPRPGSWACPHTPHCGARASCDRLVALATAKQQVAR